MTDPRSLRPSVPVSTPVKSTLAATGQGYQESVQSLTWKKRVGPGVGVELPIGTKKKAKFDIKTVDGVVFDCLVSDIEYVQKPREGLPYHKVERNDVVIHLRTRDDKPLKWRTYTNESGEVWARMVGLVAIKANQFNCVPNDLGVRNGVKSEKQMTVYATIYASDAPATGLVLDVLAVGAALPAINERASEFLCPPSDKPEDGKPVQGQPIIQLRKLTSMIPAPAPKVQRSEQQQPTVPAETPTVAASLAEKLRKLNPAR